MKKQNGEDKNYVFDSSAFLALFEDEDGADTVQELLEQARNDNNEGKITIDEQTSW